MQTVVRADAADGHPCAGLILECVERAGGHGLQEASRLVELLVVAVGAVAVVLVQRLDQLGRVDGLGQRLDGVGLESPAGAHGIIDAALHVLQRLVLERHHAGAPVHLVGAAQRPRVLAGIQTVHVRLVDHRVVLAADQRDGPAQRQRQIRELALVREAAALVVHQQRAVDADGERGALAVVQAVGFLVGAGELVARDAPLRGQLTARSLHHVDALAHGQHVAQRVHEGAELLAHHVDVAQETARGHDDGLRLHVGHAVALALHTRACAVFHDEALARRVEQELAPLAFHELLEGLHAILALGLRLRVLRVALEVGAHGRMPCAVVVGTQTGRHAEVVGELVDRLAGDGDGCLDGRSVRGPVRVLHNMVEGFLHRELDAGFLLQLRAHHERAARQRAVGHAHVTALLDDDDALAGAHGFDRGPHARAARAHDGDVAFLRLIGGLHRGSCVVGRALRVGVRAA